MTTALSTHRAPRGLEGFDKKDLMLPKALLMQGLSKLVTRDGKKVGDFVHSITKASLGTSFEFIPVAATKYFDLLKLEGDKMVFEDRTYNEDDPKLKGRIFFPDKKKGIKANATSVISYICLVNGEPLILSFSKTSYNAGKTLGTMAMMSGKDLFATRYKVSTKNTTKDNNDFYVMEVSEVGPTSDADFASAEKMYDSFGKRLSEVFSRVAADDEPADAHHHEDAPPPTEEPAGATEAAQEPADVQGELTDVPPTEPPAETKPVFTKVRVLMQVRTDADKACKKCGQPRTLKEGKVKVIDPETGLVWGKVRVLTCGKCNTLDVIEKLPD